MTSTAVPVFRVNFQIVSFLGKLISVYWQLALALVYQTAQCHNPQDQNVTILRLRTDKSTARCGQLNVREILWRLVYAADGKNFRTEISLRLVFTASLL
jgi:hypothetical protein